MAVTWTIKSMFVTKTVGSLSNVVTDIEFTLEDSETVGSGESAVVHKGFYFGSTHLAEPDSGSFTEYSSITKDDALAWVKSALGSENVTAYEGIIATQISDSKNPPTFTGLPW